MKAHQRSKPIEEIALSKTKKTAIGAALLSALLAIPLSLMISAGIDFFVLEKSLYAVQEQLIHSLEAGDSFQIQRIVSSLVKSRAVSGALVRTQNFTLGSDGELPHMDLASSPVVPNLSIAANGVSHFRTIELNGIAKTPIGYLLVTSMLSWRAIFWSVLFGVILTSLLHLYIARILTKFARSIVEPISQFPKALETKTSPTAEDEHISFGIQELDQLFYEVRHLRKRETEIERIKLEAQSKMALVSLSKQVAHDIRSPLSALNMVLATAEDIAEEKRVLVRSAIQRINDIANNLLFKKTATGESLQQEKKTSSYSLVSVVDQLVSEKRAQFRNYLGLVIEFQPDTEAYGLFAVVNSESFKSVLSNLINNAVEALPKNRGLIQVHLRGDGPEILLEIKDNGIGIPPHIIPSLGQAGKSFGKTNTDSGSGLGLYQAKIAVEKWNGKMLIFSTVGIGTTIAVRLPRSEAPTWFVKQITLSPDSKVVIVDDDASIHHIWQNRIQALNEKIELLHFSTVIDFRNWTLKQVISEQFLFLIDFEFANEKLTGLNLIKNLNIRRSSILVTSRSDEHDILDELTTSNIRMIPKGLAALVPIMKNGKIK